MKTGRLVINLTVSPAALNRMADAMRECKAAMERALPALIRESNDLYRSGWWKRSEGPPDYVADLNEPEWWQGGEEPPEYGCAA